MRKRVAVLAAALVEPAWLADGSERTKGGQVVRTRKTVVGRLLVEATVAANGMCFVRFHRADSRSSYGTYVRERAEEGRRLYDGNERASWGECAWTPYRDAKTLAESIVRRRIARRRAE
jgi:hypothetical protein